MYEEHRRPLAAYFNRQADAVHRHPLHPRRLQRPGGQEPAEVAGHRCRAAGAIDAHEYELGRSDQAVVADPARSLAHGEAGSPMVGQGLMEAEDIAGEGGSVIVDRCLSHRRPGALDSEHVHAGAAREHLPSRPLEKAEE